MFDTLCGALDVGGGDEGGLFSCLPFGHALFLDGFDCFSGLCAMVAGGL